MFIKSRYTRYSSVSHMLDGLGWPPISQRRQEARLIVYIFLPYPTLQFSDEWVRGRKLMAWLTL